jgi:Protein of unknown function (DUF3179)
MKNAIRKYEVWLSICLLTSFLLLAYPLYVIRPFRYQGGTELAVALRVIRVRPFIELGLAVAALYLMIRTWQQGRNLLPRIGSSFIAVLTLVCAALSYVNVYELMFHPLKKAVFAQASRTKLDGGEQVIAVKFAETARAYPIRVISYHHIVNDVVAGHPVVATY